MKKSFWAGTAFLAGLLWFVAGCQDQIETEPPPELHFSGNISVQMNADTLLYGLEQAAISRGFVLVTDNAGRNYPNLRISLSTTESLGSIEFVDSIRRDTANAYGRVDFVYIPNTAYSVTGTDTIKATVYDASATWYIYVQPSREIGYRYRMTMDKHSITLGPGGECDSTWVSVTVTDSLGNPPPNGFDDPQPYFSITGGYLQPQLPVMDSMGVISTWWCFRSAGYYRYYYITYRQLSDSMEVLQFP